MKKLIFMKHSEISKVKNMLYEHQGNICPILKCSVSSDKLVLDHQHKTKTEKLGENGAGCIRGSIFNGANVIEGKLRNAYIRYGIHKYISLPDLLRNLADYLENPPGFELDELYVHPTEKEKPKKLKKQSYNRLKKEFLKKYINSVDKRNKIDPNKKAKKFPEYPKSGTLTKPLQKLFEELNIDPEFYKE